MEAAGKPILIISLGCYLTLSNQRSWASFYPSDCLVFLFPLRKMCLVIPLWSCLSSSLIPWDFLSIFICPLPQQITKRPIVALYFKKNFLNGFCLYFISCLKIMWFLVFKIKCWCNGKDGKFFPCDQEQNKKAYFVTAIQFFSRSSS